MGSPMSGSTNATTGHRACVGLGTATLECRVDPQLGTKTGDRYRARTTRSGEEMRVEQKNKPMVLEPSVMAGAQGFQMLHPAGCTWAPQRTQAGRHTLPVRGHAPPAPHTH